MGELDDQLRLELWSPGADEVEDVDTPATDFSHLLLKGAREFLPATRRHRLLPEFEHEGMQATKIRAAEGLSQRSPNPE